MPPYQQNRTERQFSKDDREIYAETGEKATVGGPSVIRVTHLLNEKRAKNVLITLCRRPQLPDRSLVKVSLQRENREAHQEHHHLRLGTPVKRPTQRTEEETDEEVRGEDRPGYWAGSGSL